MSTEEAQRQEVDRLMRLHRRAVDSGFTEGSPDDRGLVRALTQKIADAYRDWMRSREGGDE